MPWRAACPTACRARWARCWPTLARSLPEGGGRSRRPEGSMCSMSDAGLSRSGRTCRVRRGRPRQNERRPSFAYWAGTTTVPGGGGFVTTTAGLGGGFCSTVSLWKEQPAITMQKTAVHRHSLMLPSILHGLAHHRTSVVADVFALKPVLATIDAISTHKRLGRARRRCDYAVGEVRHGAPACSASCHCALSLHAQAPLVRNDGQVPGQSSGRWICRPR
jgi:hypothetical protein